MDTRAPRALSNVCWFYQRPSQGPLSVALRRQGATSLLWLYERHLQ
jgi:hypothetical protein